MSNEELLKLLREKQRSQTFSDMHKEPLWEKAADEIEKLLEWKELAYEMRNRSWWAMRQKVLIKFDYMHKKDWNYREQK